MMALLRLDSVLHLLFSAAPLLSFRCVEFAANIGDIHVRRRKCQTHFLHRIRDDLRYSQIAEPLVVCRNYVPGRVLSARFCYGVFISIHIFWPKGALGVVTFTDLPLPTMDRRAVA